MPAMQHKLDRAERDRRWSGATQAMLLRRNQVADVPGTGIVLHGA